MEVPLLSFCWRVDSWNMTLIPESHFLDYLKSGVVEAWRNPLPCPVLDVRGNTDTVEHGSCPKHTVRWVALLWSLPWRNCIYQNHQWHSPGKIPAASSLSKTSGSLGTSAEVAGPLVTSLHCGHLSQCSRQDPPSTEQPLLPTQTPVPHHTMQLAPVGWVRTWRVSLSTTLPPPVSVGLCCTPLPRRTSLLPFACSLHLLKSGFDVLCRTGLWTPSSGPTIASFVWMPLPDPLTSKGHLKLLFMGCVVSMRTLKNIC